MKNAIEYIALRTFGWLMSLVPLPVGRAIGRGMGHVLASLVPIRKSVMMQNLQMAMPELSEVERTSIARGVYQNLGIVLVEIVKLATLPEKKVRGMLRYENPELMEQIIKEGGSIVFTGGHIANWECFAIHAGLYFSRPIHIIAQPQRNPYVDRWINSIRTRFGNKVEPTINAARTMLNILHNHGTVGILADQSGPEDEMIVPFFGIDVPSITAPARFALQSGARLILGTTRREPDGAYVCSLKEIVHPSTGTKQEKILSMTKEYNDLFADAIRRRPDSWLWLHRRWKHRLQESAR